MDPCTEKFTPGGSTECMAASFIAIHVLGKKCGPCEYSSRQLRRRPSLYWQIFCDHSGSI